ncbi:hypothetical protein D6C98_08948 [Aureobasidium pullulans]|nr:hypothetical protein D6D04_10341 [Aureobasidium pullulans]THY42344.1 hypothetical protein D6C98_08948 [Aureobasidium pullulans]
MPRRSLRRKSGPVSYNLALAPSVHGPSAGAKMAHEKAMRVRSKESLLDEVPKPPTSTPLRLLSNGGAEALNLDWEVGDCPGGHVSGLPAKERCHHRLGIGMRLETVAYPKGKLKQVLGKRNLDADEVDDLNWRRSRRVKVVKYPKVVDEKTIEKRSERIEPFDKSARLPSGPGITTSHVNSVKSKKPTKRYELQGLYINKAFRLMRTKL